MKWLFYLFALANTGFLAVQYWYLPAPEPAPPKVAGVNSHSAPRLALVAELDEPPQARAPAGGQMAPEPEAPSDAGATGSSAPVCYRISGLAAEEKADALAARLRDNAVEIRGRHLQQGEVTRFWVSLPPYPSREAAAKALRRLNRAGVTDHYVVTREEDRNAVSLGVFSSRQGAERRRVRVASAGLSPRITLRKIPGKVYALTVAVPPDRPIEDLLVDEKTLKIEQSRCP